MSRWISSFICVATVLGTLTQAQVFDEGWESATAGVYAPGSLIEGEEGSWLVGDTITEVNDCGVSPQQAEILQEDGNLVLLLQSVESGTVCADDVWVALTEFDTLNTGFSLAITPDTILSFDEIGALIDPEPHDSGQDCLLPPCFDNVSLLLSDNNGNILAYVLQRDPNAIANVPNVNFGDTYREVFLDPEAGRYRRNLFADFLTIPAFDPVNSQVVYIEFRVDEHGSAALDNLIIGSQVPADTVPVYRFWSPVINDHFYTANESELLFLLDNFPDAWIFETTAFYALPSASVPDAMPVYRFWAPVIATHFYTISEGERDKLIDQFSDVWVFEGIAFYAFPAAAPPPETEPVYRLFNSVSGGHLYTTSEGERDKLIDNFPDIWIFEQIAWYAYPPTSAGPAPANE